MLEQAVASNNDTFETVFATQFWQRLGVDMLRGNCRSFHRRLIGKMGREGVASDSFRDVGSLQFAGGF